MLDLYVQLQVNDGVENPAPLYISFGTKTRFANRMTLLVNAAIEGKGLSQVPVVHGPVYDDDFALAEEYEEYGEDQTEFYDGESVADEGQQDRVKVQGDISNDHTVVEGLDGVPGIVDHIGPIPEDDEARSPHDAVTDEHSEVPYPGSAGRIDDIEPNAAHRSDGTAINNSDNAEVVPDTETYLEEELPHKPDTGTDEAEYPSSEIAATGHTERAESKLVTSNNTADNESLPAESTKETGEPGTGHQYAAGDEADHEASSDGQVEYDVSNTANAIEQAEKQAVHDGEASLNHETAHGTQVFLQTDGAPDGKTSTVDGPTNSGDHTDDLDEIDFDDEEPFDEGNDSTPGLKRSWDHGLERDDQIHEHDTKRSRAS